VVAEAPLGYYREGGGRIASFTGLPNLLGMHQYEQRPWGAVLERERDAERLYTAQDPAVAADILARYGVGYVYVGQLEKAVYAGNGLSAIGELIAGGVLETAYQNQGGVLYRVDRPALEMTLGEQEGAIG